MREIAKEVDVKLAKDKAIMMGGEEEAARVDEDYDVKQSRLKAQDILARMKEKIESAHLQICYWSLLLMLISEQI